MLDENFAVPYVGRKIFGSDEAVQYIPLTFTARCGMA